MFGNREQVLFLSHNKSVGELCALEGSKTFQLSPSHMLQIDLFYLNGFLLSQFVRVEGMKKYMLGPRMAQKNGN